MEEYRDYTMDGKRNPKIQKVLDDFIEARKGKKIWYEELKEELREYILENTDIKMVNYRINADKDWLKYVKAELDRAIKEGKE